MVGSWLLAFLRMSGNSLNITKAKTWIRTPQNEVPSAEFGQTKGSKMNRVRLICNWNYLSRTGCISMRSAPFAIRTSKLNQYSIAEIVSHFTPSVWFQKIWCSNAFVQVGCTKKHGCQPGFAFRLTIQEPNLWESMSSTTTLHCLTRRTQLFEEPGKNVTLVGEQTWTNSCVGFNFRWIQLAIAYKKMYMYESSYWFVIRNWLSAIAIYLQIAMHADCICQVTQHLFWQSICQCPKGLRRSFSPWAPDETSLGTYGHLKIICKAQHEMLVLRAFCFLKISETHFCTTHTIHPYIISKR